MDDCLADIRASAAQLTWNLQQAQRDARSQVKTPSSLNSATRLSEQHKKEEEKIQGALRDMERINKGWDEMSRSVRTYREVTASMDKKESQRGEVKGEEIKGEEVKSHRG
jgi:hypothetical protein